MSILDDYQLEAVNNLKNGNILCGGVGSGKSRTALGYYFKENGGKLSPFTPMENPKDLYIITTARKRDDYEWIEDMLPYLLNVGEDNYYSNKVVIDSWNNIHKYCDVKDAFFIFDEQRVVGYGSWTKNFLKITKANDWILLSATHGDKWSDYIPVFIANGFYKNKTEFTRRHAVYAHNFSYPKIVRYLEVNRLIRLRNSILVKMNVPESKIEKHYEDIPVDYNSILYKTVLKTRWNTFNDTPIENVSQLCSTLRRIINSDVSRELAVLEILDSHDKAIIFYNYDYELEILKKMIYAPGTKIAEWNGHVHDPIPDSEKWVYLVNYMAGAEGWNCIKTNCIIFYSLNYSYKIMVQSAGRIDRRNTPFKDLYYYRLYSKAPMDSAIRNALRQKKSFNESSFSGYFQSQKKTVL